MVLSDEPVISALQTTNLALIVSVVSEASVEFISDLWPQIATIDSQIPECSRVSIVSCIE